METQYNETTASMIESDILPAKDAVTTDIYVRLAKNDNEVLEAQRLRYKVFYEEYGAKPTPLMFKEKRDFDEFDGVTDHLIVLAPDQESGEERIVGTYRLLRPGVAKRHGRFYTSDEYDLSVLQDSDNRLLEVGRSCVLAEHRTKQVLNLLWEGIADYITEHDIDILFGCASFHGTNEEEHAEQLSYLHHFHLAPEDIRPRALKQHYVDMNLRPKESLNEKRLFVSLPPLIKGYLRVGGSVGDGAVIDQQFNTTDIFIMVQTKKLTERYRKHYERKLKKPMPGQGA